MQLDAQNRTLQRAKEDHEHAKGAKRRRDQLIKDRRKYYRECIQTFVQETGHLKKLYARLHDSFSKTEGTLGRLRVSVDRLVDLEGWIDRGKDLFDLRMESSLRGQDALRQTLKRELYSVWLTGDADRVSEVMADFIKNHYMSLRQLRKPSIKSDSQIAIWEQAVASWIYSTDHISLSYSMTYDNVPIERLSQGTRGIVLLMLYLVIDIQDKRPLIIDQPEENLDPRSVYEELVGHFREARKRRQVIIVTHNANLVVNADADQIIVADTVPNPYGGLPTINYESGSLEDRNIRTAVCRTLEGGERAFQDRERRYRLQRRPGALVT